MRLMCRYEEIGGWDFREEKRFRVKWESKCPVNKCLHAIKKQWDTEGNLEEQALAGFPQAATPTPYSVVISDEISLPNPGILSKLSDREGKSKELFQSCLASIFFRLKQ